MRIIDANDPRVKAAARELGVTVILRAWEADGVLTIQDPWRTCEVPVVNPSPSGERSSPTRLGREGEVARDDTLAKPVAGFQETDALDDFTAIDGVGPVTAEKLHNLGLYTYDDLREWLARPRAAVAEEVDNISERTIGQIEAWLSHRLM